MAPHRISPFLSLEFSQHANTDAHDQTDPPRLHPSRHRTDFIGGAEALPVMSAAPGQVVPGSDFVGGAVSLTANIEHGETDMEECAA
jgi:hypothetical protein